ncbi:MAG: cobalamin B12-binding domain-containing protein [Gemmatimonadetes bacterium]|nr:cobalamin B12-binding domain-containing protein [Gemmatimonadota bacterium]MBT5800277.1 cobalamin B12-binding domain-containing protein [Gemmatimonadota bacterium]MBT7421622.1 cobalamin B12-binding domain-containing protein [Gemmatimonadota bacterium]
MKRHFIKVAMLRTGLTSHTIRVWEKRYNAVSPGRTETNRRLYSDDDIAHLHLLHQVTQGGHRIGDIAHLSPDELHRLTTVLPAQPNPLQVPHEIAGQQGYVDRALQSIRQLDAIGLEGELTRADSDFGHTQLIEQVIEPLMRRVGELWHEGSLRITDEHLASAVVRRFIDGIRQGLQTASDAPHLIVTTPTGQVHEMGALLVSVSAAAAHWRVTYMGPNLPADQIALVARHNGASAVALSLVYPLDDPALGHELIKIRQALGDELPLIVGGPAAQYNQPILRRIGAVQLGALTELRQQLYNIHSTDARN